MNKYLLAFIFCITVTNAAKAFDVNQLIEVNKEWMNNYDGREMALSFSANTTLSFHDMITKHLMLVEKTLRARSVEGLNPSQIANRIKLLDVLNVYWHSASYPVNDYLPYKNPVFIDRKGTHCAVGYLMQQSGAENLARAIDADNKFVYVKEIKTKGVAEWATENGFKIDELAWIQPGYPAQFNAGDMARGLNGQVYALAVDPSSGFVYAGGSFSTSTTGNPCNGIAVYVNGITGWEWIGLGNGIGGQVNTILIYNNKLYAGGYFNSAGSVSASNIAVYDLASQQWQAMGSLDSTVQALVVYNNEIYAGGKFTGMVSKWTGSQWQDITQGFIYGEGVRTLESWDNLLLIGGSFELATGALRKNVACYDGTQMLISGMGTLTPVNDFENFRDTLYAACDIVSGTDTCAIAKFVNADWEIALKPYSGSFDYFGGNSVNSFISEQDKLICAGDFSCTSGLFYGNNMMEFRHDPGGQTYCVPLLIVDDAILSIVNNSNAIVFGGRFSNALGDTLNHIGQLFDVLNGTHYASNNITGGLTVFPSPSSGSVRIRLENFVPNQEILIRITDLTGQKISNVKMSTPDFNSEVLSGLPAGVYYFQAMDSSGKLVGSQKVVVAP